MLKSKVYQGILTAILLLFILGQGVSALTYQQLQQATQPQSRGQVLGAATPARVQFASGSGSFTKTVNVNLPGATTAGNEIIVAIAATYQGNTFTVTDNANNVWHLAASASYSSGQMAVIFYAENISASSNPQITVTLPANDYFGVTAVEYSGLATSNSLDVTSTNVEQTITSYSSGSLTTTAANDLLFGVHQIYCPGATANATAPFSAISTNNGSVTLQTQSYVASSVGSYNSQGTDNCGNGYNNSVLAAFKAGSSGSSGSAPSINSFAASPSSITSGQSSSLSWSTSGATSATISSVGSVATSGSTNVSPSVTTTYTLTASNSNGPTTANATVTVSSGGNNPPVISGVSSSGITSSGATLNWTTDINSDSQVDYGTTNGYGSSSALNSSLVTSHSVSLFGLSASTLYHYRVKSSSNGNLSVSADNTFTTSAVNNGGGSTITWTWQPAASPIFSGWLDLFYDPLNQQTMVGFG